MASTGMTVLWFVVIVAMIPLALWMLKRSGLATGGSGSATAIIKPISQLNIGPGQRLVTVEVGTGDARTWLVLGVTAQHINTLHTMAPGKEPDISPGEPPNFSSILRRSLGMKDDA